MQSIYDSSVGVDGFDFTQSAERIFLKPGKSMSFKIVAVFSYFLILGLIKSNISGEFYVILHH